MKHNLEPLVFLPLFHWFGILVLRQIFLVNIGIMVLYTWVHFLPWECWFHGLRTHAKLAEMLCIVRFPISHPVHPSSSEGALECIPLCVVLISRARLEIVVQLAILKTIHFKPRKYWDHITCCSSSSNDNCFTSSLGPEFASRGFSYCLLYWEYHSEYFS